MKTYCKKPVVVTAIQYNGTNTQRIIDFTQGQAFISQDIPGGITIPNIGGDLVATEGDFVIRGVKGEFYPCKPDVFASSYDQVSD